MTLGGDRMSLEAGAAIRAGRNVTVSASVETPWKKWDPRAMLRLSWVFGRRR